MTRNSLLAKSTTFVQLLWVNRRRVARIKIQSLLRVVLCQNSVNSRRRMCAKIIMSSPVLHARSTQWLLSVDGGSRPMSEMYGHMYSTADQKFGNRSFSVAVVSNSLPASLLDIITVA